MQKKMQKKLKSTSVSVSSIKPMLQPTTDEVVIFVCNGRYHSAVSMGIASLRADGGYNGDVAVILEEDSITKDQMREAIVEGERKALTTSTTNISTAITEDEISRRLFLFSVEELVESLFSEHNRQGLDYLRQPPPLSSCKEENRKAGHNAYYRKILIYHPSIALRWERVLYLDACMTFHLPYVDWIFDLSSIQQPRKLLAALDPWRWRRRGQMKGQLLTSMQFKSNSTNTTTCVGDPDGEKLLRRLVLKKDRDEPIGAHHPSALSATPFFNSAFILYDSHVVRNYKEVTNSASSTIIEIMILYHLLGQVFRGGDQLIQSVYWMYLRDRNEFGVLEKEFWDDGDILPYSFEPPTDETRTRVIMSGGNLDRPVCSLRPVNKALFVPSNDDLSVEERRRNRWNDRSHQREWRLRQKRKTLI
jgi:hypothetical protein